MTRAKANSITSSPPATDTLPAAIDHSKSTPAPGRAKKRITVEIIGDTTSLEKAFGRARQDSKSNDVTPAPAYIETHMRDGGQPVHGVCDAPNRSDGLLLTIKTLGNLLDDLERVRIMNDNRIGALEREFGSSLPELDVIAEQLQAVEHAAELNLKRAWRRHPLAPWAKAYPGIGEKLIARLIAEIGDPSRKPLDSGGQVSIENHSPNASTDVERTVSQLRAYCGVGDPARKRKSGMTQEEAFKLGNPKAKKLCWLISESFVKVNRGPGREAYDAAREKYAERVHATACVRCGPSGKPAAPGSPWSLKHQHEAAKRFAVKQFLKELWIASRHLRADDQGLRAGGKS